MELGLEFRAKLKDYYLNKQFSKIESSLESLKSLDSLPIDIKYLYAISKSLNPKSKKKDLIVASYFFEKVYITNKLNFEPLYNLILTSIKSASFEFIEPHITEAYEKNKNDPKILEGLAKMHTFYGNMVQASFYYLELIKIKPNYTDAWRGLLVSLNYHDKVSQSDYLKYCKKFDQLPHKEFKKLNIREIRGKIKVGFLSPDFKNHSVSFFLEDILKQIEKNDFELFALSNLDISSHDDMTIRLKKIFDRWEDVSEFNDQEFIEFTRNLNLDILIDLSGYFIGNRIQSLRAKCAPIQISWLGYCNTLGIKNMDYLIADKNVIPMNEQNEYSEKILYMPNIWCTISPPKNLEKIDLIKNKDNKIFTYGSFNNFQKISDNTIKVWSKILNETGSKLILKNSLGDNSKRLNDIILNKFKNQKVDINKVSIISPMQTRHEHLNCYNLINLSLDTFPYPGVTTTFESILMGVPVLTKKGFNFNSRCGESINTNVGLIDFIAENDYDYVEKAISFQSKLKFINEIGFNTREKFLRVNMLSTKKFSNDFANLLKNIYK